MAQQPESQREHKSLMVSPPPHFAVLELYCINPVAALRISHSDAVFCRNGEIRPKPCQFIPVVKDFRAAKFAACSLFRRLNGRTKGGEKDAELHH